MQTHTSSVVPLNPASDAHQAAASAAAHSNKTLSPALPLVLGLLALLSWLVFQTTVLWSERSVLATAHQGQQQTVDNAGKLRGQLDALAADTQRLADTGNTNAALLVAELKQRGITINPNAGATKATGAQGK